MITNIRTLKYHLEYRKIDGNDAIAIMTVIRKQLEQDVGKRYEIDRFRWLKHFCDWCLHPKLEHSIVSVDIINSFSRAFLQAKMGQVVWSYKGWELKFEDNRESINNYFDLIINNLRTELTEFLNTYHINTELIKTDENFIHLFGRIFYIVKDSPLEVPEKILKKKKNRQWKKEYDELSTSFYKKWIWSKGVYVSTELYPIGINIFHNLDGSFGLSVEMKNSQSFTFKPITYHGGIFLMQPEAVNEHFHRGNALVDKGELEKAATAFQQSINIWPTSAACCNLSSVLSKLGKHNEALSTAEKAIELNPDDHIAWTNKSQALNSLKNYE